MSQKLRGKVALITGAASPIGIRIAERLGKEGVRLALTYHKSLELVRKVTNDFKSQGFNAKFFCVDLSKPDEAEKLIENVTKEFGSLDVLINNASTFYETPLGKTNAREWDNILNTNTRGPFLLIQAAIPWLEKSSGCVVNITDIYGSKPILKNRIPYCVSKAALNGLTKAFAYALAPKIRVNAIAPGAINFPDEYSEQMKKNVLEKIPLGRQGEGADIAEAVLFLLMDAQYVTGQIISVDGGRSI